MKLFQIVDDELFWLDNGVSIFHKLFSIWLSWCKKNGFHKVKTPLYQIGKKNLNIRPSILENHKNLLAINNSLAEWGVIASNSLPARFSLLFSTHTTTVGVAHSLCSHDQTVSLLISSLQSINEIIRMFGINTQWYWATQKDQYLREAVMAAGVEVKEKKGLSKLRLELNIKDILDREWPGPYIEINKHSENVLIVSSLFGSIERFIALLIENAKGQNPFERLEGKSLEN